MRVWRNLLRMHPCGSGMRRWQRHRVSLQPPGRRGRQVTLQASSKQAAKCREIGVTLKQDNAFCGVQSVHVDSKIDA